MTTPSIADLEAKLADSQKRIDRLCQTWTDDHCHAQTLALRCGATHEEIQKAMTGDTSIRRILDLIASKITSPK